MNKLHRLLRYDWPLHFVLLLTNWMPDNILFLSLRGFLAHFFLGTCGKNFRLGRNLSFYNPSMIFLGDDIYIAYGSWFMAGAEIRIEDKVLIGPYCVVVASNHQWNSETNSYDKADREPILIRHGTWIAAHVTITAGTDIGMGCIIAAGAVVNGEIPAYSMAGGIPARIIKKVVHNQDG